MAALQIVTMVVDLIIQLIVIPYLERLQRELEQAYRDELQRQIERYYQQRIQRDVERAMFCALERLRQYEARGQQAYFNMRLGVVFEDTSRPGLGEILERQPPETIFDMDFYELKLDSVTLGTSPIEESAGELTDTERNAWYLLTGEGGQLWRQSISFSFVAPSVAEIEALYGGPSNPPPSCDCFIATACYGSALAPEVGALRRFRDDVLMRSRAGRGFVAMYYALSPPIAAFLRTHPAARHVVRNGLVAPAVGIVRWIEARRAGSSMNGGRS